MCCFWASCLFVSHKKCHLLHNLAS
uniref:Uncharacterized protein n=1 Tax=Rhizophora mucronata TaxID=61149 RepID=A0A2P2NKR7_RHIMU